MRGITIILLIIFTLFVQGNRQLYAQKGNGEIKDILSKKYSVEKDLCAVLKSLMDGTFETKEVVKAAIEMGFREAAVVKCAIESGGDVERIIVGAIEAGAAADVISKGAVEAGADADLVADVLRREGVSLAGYMPSAETESTTLIIGLPGGDASGGFVSPSSF